MYKDQSWSSNIVTLLASLAFVTTQVSGQILANKTTSTGSSCRFDLNNPWKTLKLIDLGFGIPYTNENGKFRKSSIILDQLPMYDVHQADQRNDQKIYNLKLDTEYLSLLSNGSLVFTSNQAPQPSYYDDNNLYLTTIFSISCGGDLTIDLPPQAKNRFNLPPASLLSRLAAHPPSPSRLRRRGQKQPPPKQQAPPKQPPPFPFLDRPAPKSASGPPHPQLIISNQWQTGTAPRCPAQTPLGLRPFVKPAARGSYYNGCGAENGMKVPDLRFEQCCNRHDLCYDNCGITWEDCNDEFRDCNHAACDAAYPEPLPGASSASSAAGKSSSKPLRFVRMMGRDSVTVERKESINAIGISTSITTAATTTTTVGANGIFMPTFPLVSLPSISVPSISLPSISLPLISSISASSISLPPLLSLPPLSLPSITLLPTPPSASGAKSGVVVVAGPAPSRRPLPALPTSLPPDSASLATWLATPNGIAWLNWGCHVLADTYADAVGTVFGTWAFAASNVDRCECRCPVGSFDCGAACMMECEPVDGEAAVGVRKGAPGYYGGNAG